MFALIPKVNKENIDNELVRLSTIPVGCSFENNNNSMITYI